MLVSENRIWQFIRAGSLDGVWYWDLENPENEWMSPEFWDVLGYDPATKPHDPAAWQDLIHPDDLKTAIRNFDAHCADPAHPYDQIVRYLHADGSTVWVRCRGMAIRDAGGKPIRMLGAHNDVTPHKLAEQSANEAQQIAHQANEELRAFAYSTYHDLKSPANTIQMLLQEARRALRSGIPSDADAMLSKAETTNDAMRMMVDKLLEYTHLVGSEAAHEPVDLDRIVADVIDSLGADIAGTKAEISVGALGMVLGAEWQLRQLVQNLIANAIKFQSRGKTPRVEIRAQPYGTGRLSLVVSDNGIGIPESDQKRIFDLFGRLHNSADYPGAGIGLAFCARVVKAHGGEIGVASSGEGTAFTFDLPKYEEDPG